MRVPVTAVAVAFALVLVLVPSFGCPSSCALYLVAITVQDQSTGNLLCEGTVTFGPDGAKDAMALDASIAPQDAEVPSGSQACQWDVVVTGGSFVINVTAPGFSPSSATVQLPKDECGATTVPVSVMVARS